MPNVLILGASSDIAIALAHKFAQQGYSLSLASRGLDELDKIKNDLIIRYAGEVDTYFFDACQFDTHQEFINKLKNFPDITICVFGLMEEEEKALDDWNTAMNMINTNFTGAVSILNLMVKAYISKNRGTIVGISSVAGDRGRQSKLIYGSSKAAFSAYLSGLRNLTYQYGVHVISVKPGFVETKMTENLDLPPFLTAKPKLVAEKVYKAIKSKKNEIYIKWFWRYIMLFIKTIPEGIFKKMKI
jgi:short-subunit dehydrogenase